MRRSRASSSACASAISLPGEAAEDLGRSALVAGAEPGRQLNERIVRLHGSALAAIPDPTYRFLSIAGPENRRNGLSQTPMMPPAPLGYTQLPGSGAAHAHGENPDIPRDVVSELDGEAGPAGRLDLRIYFGCGRPSS